YHKVLIAPFVLILNHSFMLSLVVNITLTALPGDTTQSLTSLPSHFNSSLYADVNGFLNPSIITGENYRPDLLFLIQSKCLYVLELTVGFESNLNNNAVRKKEKYLNLINEISRNYRCVRFVNLSISSLGVFSDECSTFLDMMNDIGIDKKQQRY
ncbi:unnamed protein product, partial [Porites evermanni]